MKKPIEIIGARVNNLKDVEVSIPRESLTVITGVSGSGKSSLAFDTLYAEGQRRFLESLSTYARSRLPLMKKPDVNMILGLSPVVSIQQKKGISNPRSTVGSLTDISSYLRLLMSVAADAYCPYCEKQIRIDTSNKIAERIQSLPKDSVVEIRAPMKRIFEEPYRYLFDLVRNKGYRKLKINGEIYDTSHEIELEDELDYDIEVIIDKFVINGDIHKQIIDSVEHGLVLGQRFIIVEILETKLDESAIKEFYHSFTCPDHYFVACETKPWYFTSNDLESACDTCLGVGTHMVAEPFLLIQDENKSLMKGAIEPFAINMNIKTFKRMANRDYIFLYSLSQHYNFDLEVPFKELDEEIKDLIFYGTKGKKFTLIPPPEYLDERTAPKRKFNGYGTKVVYTGIISRINRWYKQYYSKKRNPNSVDEKHVKQLLIEHICPECKGKKLKYLRFQIQLNNKTIYQLGNMTISDLIEAIQSIKIPEEKEKIATPVLKELIKRLGLMEEIGLGYLSLNRRSDTLSGGEIQRTALSTQMGSELIGMLYILDEPSIGLHPRDSSKLLNVLKRLKNVGNTVIVVEHDLQTMRAADHIIEIGPGPGIHGGEIIATGNIDQISQNPKSLTGKYFTGELNISYPEHRRLGNGKQLIITGATENNLKNINVKLPLGLFICITGVSGSGKSSLINEILYKKLCILIKDKRIIAGEHESLTGYESIKDIRNIDQSPIGRSTRSNPATYVGFYNKIRDVYANLEASIAQKYTIKDFSFNSSTGGRCVNCKGEGIIKTQMQYMPDVEAICPDCNGQRFNEDILEIRYQGKNIAEILEMSVEEGLEFFSDIRLIQYKLQTMADLGLGYLKLGQSSTTLSGGEAQRIKLAKELGKIKSLKNNLYILDEPTTGLHLNDINMLLKSLNKLVDAGNTVLVIEHHLDVIKNADYIVDIGPRAAEEGGEVVACGTPEDIIEVKESYTGQFLSKALKCATEIFS